MLNLKRGDIIMTRSGYTSTVASNGVHLNSCGRPIVSVFTGQFYIPCDVDAIVTVNGVLVDDIPQQAELWSEQE